MRSAFLAATLSFAAYAQPTMPTWLAAYPGVTAQTTAFKALTTSTYTAPAKPAAVTDHYRQLFAAQSLAFIPNSDGIGAVVRASAPECDLLLTIHPQDSGTQVRVDCAAKSAPADTWVAVPDTTRAHAPARGPKNQVDYQTAVANAAERHQQMVKELNIHPVYHDAPAPPLTWPDWLVHVKGSRLAPRAGVDRASHDYLRTSYVTSQPMTAVYAFYEDLLNANGYPVHNSKLGTGQTMSGVMQNADGHVEGINYPNGHPGPYTEIRVNFRRTYLNDPVTVDLTFTTYAFKAPPPFGQ